MICFLTRRVVQYTVRDYLGGPGAELRDRIRVRAYEGRAARFQPGTWVFADLEALSAAERRHAARLHRRLCRRGLPCLNDPADTLRRYALLRSLHDAGRNHFNVYRPAELRSTDPRYPVFLRGERDHEGPTSELLRNRAELDDALAGRPPDTLVVEFLDTADGDGIYRKYSAFRVGRAMLPRHLFFSRDWMVKAADLREPRLLEEERRWVEAGGDRIAELDAIFRIAKVDWGRIDYSLHEGRIQVWEINTNPAIVSAMSFEIPERRPVHERFAARLNERLRALDEAGPDPDGPLVWNPNPRWVMPWTW